MFPFRYSSIFRSRWIALLWAGGMLWWALDVAGKPHADADANQAATASAPSTAEANQAQELLRKFGG